MKVAITKNSWLHGSDLRLDASFHLSEGRQAKNTIMRLSIEKQNLSKLSLKIYNGARFKRVYVSDKNRGIAFMGSSDMLKSDFYGLKYLSKVYTKNISELLIKKDWILVSCSGTIGNTVYTSLDFDGKAASQHIMRIIPDNSKIKSGYLYAYLSSKYGYSLLTQGTYGAVIQHIEPEHIENIPVPIFHENKQLEIHNLIVKSAELRVTANKMLEDVISEIEDKYAIMSKKLCYSTNIKSILKGDKFTNETRVEADFYQPQAEKLIYELKKQEWSFLGDLANKIQRSGLRERHFVKVGIPLITGQNLNLNKLGDLKMLSRKFTRNIEKNTTKDNDVLISVQGTIGKIEYSYKNIYQGVFASEQLTKVSVKQELIHPGYIYAFLKSKLGKIQLQKHKTGSVIEWIIENNIASTVVPIPNDKGFAIGSIVDKLTLMRQEACNYETTAIQLVETEIEQWQH
jgi:Restriction endonuclease S subunits